MKMLVFFGVLVFAGASMGSLTRVPVCRFNQTGPCYGAVGHPLYLQMGPEDELYIRKFSVLILKVRNQKITQNPPDYPRWQFVPDNRTVIINRAEKRDSGSYTLDTYDSGGAARGSYHLQLVTEDAVSSVKVTFSCSSSEKRRVYCSSDGENVTYSWTFSGTPHTDHLVDGNQTLLLDKEAVGSVTCYAQNHVSQEHKTIELDPCPGSLSSIPVCRFTQTDLCYGAVGHPLHLQLEPEDELYIRKLSDLILKVRNQQIIQNHPDYPRWQFVADNRTVIINRAEKRDSGSYTLDTYDSGGAARGSYHLQLVTEDVVSSVKVTFSCSSSEKRRVYCSSDGENVTYSWTFSGTPHTDQLVDGNQTLLLDKESVGDVTCYAQNHVSQEHKTIILDPCPGSLSSIPVCRFTQTDLCYGAVGHPLYLQLEPEDELYIRKLSVLILKVRNQQIIQNHPDYPRWQFVPDNRTVIINRAEKRDSGSYTLDTYDSGGAARGSYYLQLVTEDVVSSVKVTFSCSSSEKRRVYCSSDGEGVTYSWTFRGTSYTDQLADGNQTLLLDKEAVGSVTCYAQNHVSSGNKTIQLDPCPGSLSSIPVCRFTQTDLCYGAVGHPLYLQLEPENELVIKKLSDLILKVRNQQIIQNHPDYPRWQFVPDNRTVIISRAEKRDSGTYTLDTYDSGGAARGSYPLQLVTEDAVSSVKVTFSCSSSEKRRVYCSSDGENVHYSWTFRGTPHTDQLADGNQTLLLDKESVGSVTCYAQNHVSQEHKTIILDPCPGSLSSIPVCRFTQTDPCYGAVGHPLYLQLEPEDELYIRKFSVLILKVRNQQIIQNHPDYLRWQFVPDNRTVIISRAEKRDSGSYTLDTHDSGGAARGSYHLQLVTEDVVSSVEVTFSCSSSEKRRVYCSSDGEGVTYSWTFRGTSYTDQLVDGNQTLLLDKESVGSVTCFAQNHVSSGNKTIQLDLCPGSLTRVPVCRFTQTDPCYGAVGHPLYLQLEPEDELYIRKFSVLILKVRNQQIIQNHPEYPRWQFVPDNRTVIINRAEKRDSGSYTLDTYDSGGTVRGSYPLQLVIEDVVSSVEVTYSCSSSGKGSVYCSSDGEGVTYSWTFRGTPHTDQLADGNQTLLLDKESARSVTCYAQNHVSRGNKTIELHQCPDTVYVWVWVLEMLILVSLLGGFHVYARIQRKRTKRAANKEEEVEEAR